MQREQDENHRPDASESLMKPLWPCVPGAALFALILGLGAGATALAIAPSHSADGPTRGLWPPMSPPVLTWFSVLVVLLVALQTRPWTSIRNLDALVLVLIALLLALREDQSYLPADRTGLTLRGWTYLLLPLAAGYWLLRGLWLMRARLVAPPPVNLSDGASVVLLAAALTFALAEVSTAPLSAGSRDGLVGGLYMAETGKLPHGQAEGFDARSPLLHILHAAFIRLEPPVAYVGEKPLPMTWQNRAEWIAGTWWTTLESSPARLLNGVLVILAVAGLAWIGGQLHSATLGVGLAAIFCAFPGATECFSRPEIMLPTTLLIWSLAFALVPGIGGLLSMFLGVLAGVAWPWCWLGLPATLGYFLRKGWNGVGASAGLLAGLVTCLFGMTALTDPGLPRAPGALSAAGLSPAYVATLDAAGRLRLTESEPSTTQPHPLQAGLWRFLLNGDHTIVPNSANVPFRAVQAEGPAREELQRHYREAIAAAPEATRLWVALRTILEATWIPAVQPQHPVEPVWQVWTTETVGSQLWTQIRRGLKLLCGVLALLAAIVLLQMGEPRPYQLVGALATVFSAALFTSEPGAVTNWVWLLPAMLATIAAHGRALGLPPQPLPQPAEALGPAPRITIND